MTTKTITMILVLMLIAVVMPVLAGTPREEGICIVPPNDYFVKDGPMNGQPVHEGLQLGFIVWVPNTKFHPHYEGGYLHQHGYVLGKSHNDQDRIAFGKYFYCDSLPDHPYEP